MSDNDLELEGAAASGGEGGADRYGSLHLPAGPVDRTGFRSLVRLLEKTY